MNEENKKLGNSFKFTQKGLERRRYQKAGIKRQQPNKLFDTHTEGLALFITPNGEKTFYAFAKVKMYNKKKQLWENNNKYKKMFPFHIVPKSLDKAKLELPHFIELIKNPKKAEEAAAAETKFGDLVKDFMKSGLGGFRLADKTEKHEYKPSTVKKYQKIINGYILLKKSSYIRTPKQIKAWDDKCKLLGGLFTHKGRASQRYLKDVPLSEINQWEIEVLHARMKNTPTIANDVLKVVSIIFSWTVENDLFSGGNPCSSVIKYPEKKIKMRLSNEDVEKVLDHCEGKAFDYDPFFYTLVALALYLGKRMTELFGLRWKQPYNQKDIKLCSGWLEQGWSSKNKFIYLHDTKNRKPERVYLDDASLKIIRRLEKARLTERNDWSLKSAYLFPQTIDPSKCATESSYRKKLAALNKRLGLAAIEKDSSGKIVRTELGFKFKFARKTMVSRVEETHGLEIASKKANHSSTRITKDHYVVSADTELQIDNVYNRGVKKSDWNTEAEKEALKDKYITSVVSKRKNK